MKKVLLITLPVFIAFVFLQSLPFKFQDSLATQYIFQTLAEWSGLAWFGHYGGYMIGIFELIASLFLLIPLLSRPILKRSLFPALQSVGALMALGIMSGAIFFHLFTPLGVVVPNQFDPATGQAIGNDSGVLFTMACLTWLSALILIICDLKNPDSHLGKLIGKTNNEP